MKKTKILCIFDGFGIGPDSVNNCITRAKMPNFRRVLKEYYWTTLNADGESVGQEAGLVGNSEVGHMNIGGLQLVPQLSYQITASAEQGFGCKMNMSINQQKNSPFFKRGGSEADGVFAQHPKLPQNKSLKIRARELRKSGNLSEVLLWVQIKNKKLLNLDFTRQKIIGNYIVDFYCSELALVIEIDGESHEYKGEYDLKRQNYLENFGLTVFRFQDIELKKSMNLVLEALFKICESRLKIKNNTPSPLVTPLLRKGEFPNQLFDPKEYLQSKFELSENKTIHLIGLFSTGTIHSDMRHLIGSIEAAGRAGADKILLHLITDGRDSDRQSLVETWQVFLTKFETRLQPFANTLFLGSVGGRFYGMDRDKNWERILVQITPWFALSAKENNLAIPDFVEQGYGWDVLEKSNILMQKLTDNLKQILLTDEQKIELENSSASRILEILKNGTNINLSNVKNFLKDYSDLNYKNEIYDETLIPACLHQIQANDTIWLLDFRSDRMKQITTVLCHLNNELQLGLDILGMNDYGIGQEVLDEVLRIENNQGYKPIFQTKQVVKTLAETIANLGQTQLHIAETEKYAHVTYFLNGGSQDKHNGEDWIVIPSNKVESHAEKPEMKAKEITDYIIRSGLGVYDYIIVNYANPDMVAHTGLIPESIESIEFLDQQLGRLLEVVEQGGHSMIITADHGNCEFVGPYQRKVFSFSKELNKELEANQNLTDTEHNPNPVPCVIVDERFKKRTNSGFDSQEYLKEIKNNKIFDNLNIDYTLLQKVLEQQKHQNLDDYWLSKEEIAQIVEFQLPLWYAGVLLLSLMMC